MKRFICCVFLLLSSCAFAAEPGIQFAVDRSSMTIGDLVRLAIAVTLPDDAALAAPEKSTEIGAWAVKDLSVAPDPAARGVTRLVYTLTTYTTGQVTIPPVAVAYTRAKDPAAQSLATQPVTITVESVLDKYGTTGDIMDIKPPIGVRLPVWTYFLWTLLGLAVLGGAYWWYRRYRQKLAGQFPVPEVPRVPPYQLAMERLARLKQSSLLSDGSIKEFYSELSDIIRDYLSGLYDIETRDMTTAEIYAQLRHKETDKKVLAAIKTFFDACDLVKFAKYRPMESAAWQDFEQAEHIVTNKG